MISRQDIDHIVESHLLPSLAIYKTHPFPENSKVLDVGSGGGLPGIPLAIVMPDVKFTLIDSVGKKLRAIEEFVQKLGLKNVVCINDRVENLRKKYDYIVGRAVANIAAFRILAQPRVTPHGKVLYLSGGTIPSVPDTRIVDLFELYQNQYCETKKLLIFDQDNN